MTAWTISSTSLVVIDEDRLEVVDVGPAEHLFVGGHLWVPPGWWSVRCSGRGVDGLASSASTRRAIRSSHGPAVGQVELDGAEEQEAEADGVAEAHDRLGVERGVDGAGGLRLGDEVGEAVAAQVEGALHEAAHLGVAPGGDEGLEQQGALGAHLVGDEVRADRGEDVGDLALEAVLVEELVELAVGPGLDGREEQLGLAR